MHVDAASGGFVAPFLHPDLEWDFRLPVVKSINVSGHKYGLTYPGVGFAVWRDEQDLPGRPGLPRELPRRRHADVHAQLLPARKPDRRPVLQLRPPGSGRLPRVMKTLRDMAISLSEQRREARSVRAAQRRLGHPGLRVHAARPEPVHRCSTSPTGSVGSAGRCPAYTMPANAQDLAVLRVVSGRASAPTSPTCSWSTSPTPSPTSRSTADPPATSNKPRSPTRRSGLTPAAGGDCCAARSDGCSARRMATAWR